LSVLRSVTNGSDGVIEIGSAGLGVEDTALVIHEVVVLSINGDTGWLFGDGGLKLFNVLLWHLGVGSSLDDFLGLLSFAGLGSGDVWVVLLELLWVILEVLESPDFETSLAST